MDEMFETGTIKRLVGDKGFGFIRCDSGEELFVHATNMVGRGMAFAQLREGTRVSFVIAAGGEKGPRATKVAII